MSDLAAAALGDAARAYQLGDYASALLHAQRAAAAGAPQGATLIGHLRLHGLVGEPDLEDAARWFEQAAEAGEPDALLILARLAESGEANLPEWRAAEFLERAAETGDARGALAYGLYLKNTNDPGQAPDALNWLGLAAQAGHPPALAAYAEALDQWPLGPQDPAAARPWYIEAGQAGYGAAALQAGLMLINGEGGAADRARGEALIQTAAELAVREAMGQWALILLQGPAESAPDPARAAFWAERGAALGDAESQFLYAYILAAGLNGARTPDTLEAAYIWILRAGRAQDGLLAEDPDRLGLQAAIEADLSRLDPGLITQLRLEAFEFTPAER